MPHDDHLHDLKSIDGRGKHSICPSSGPQLTASKARPPKTPVIDSTTPFTNLKTSQTRTTDRTSKMSHLMKRDLTGGQIGILVIVLVAAFMVSYFLWWCCCPCRDRTSRGSRARMVQSRSGGSGHSLWADNARPPPGDDAIWSPTYQGHELSTYNIYHSGR
jgi:hypothetical protein